LRHGWGILLLVNLAQPEDNERWAVRVAAANVLGLDGVPIRVRDIWRDGPTVTAFLRHYGCLFCLQFVHDVTVAAPEIIARGARLLLIGNGSVEQAKHFFQERGLPRVGCVVTTDPARESYAAAELQRGYTRTFLDKGARKAFMRAREQGHHITGLFGDLTQLGGLMVTRPPAQLVYFHRSQFAGDHPNLQEVIAAIDG
jgi:AhpC/TSA antioxidant enzyme